MKMIIATLFLKNLGCYGSVKVKNEIPNSYESQMKSNQKPDLKWGREIRDPLKDIISLNDTMALVLTHRGRIMGLNLNNGKRESSSWTPSGEKINSISLNRDKKWFAYVSKGDNQIGVYDFKLGRLIWKKEITVLPSLIELSSSEFGALTLKMISALKISDLLLITAPA